MTTTTTTTTSSSSSSSSLLQQGRDEDDDVVPRRRRQASSSRILTMMMMMNSNDNDDEGDEGFPGTDGNDEDDYIYDMKLLNELLGDDDDDDTDFGGEFDYEAELAKLQAKAGSDPFKAETAPPTKPLELKDDIGLNELHTLLIQAVAQQDYIQASDISTTLMQRLYRERRQSSSASNNDNDDNNNDTLPLDDEAFMADFRSRLSWLGLGTAPWLCDQLEFLNYTFPTTIQIHALEAVNSMLLEDYDKTQDGTTATATMTTITELGQSNSKDMGMVISGTTGSGKTLAFLVPVLSTLSDSLFIRQRIRIGAEERMIGDTTEDFLARVLTVSSPEMRGGGSARPLSSSSKNVGGITTGAALSSLGTSGTNVKHPLALIVVPTKELGMQIAQLCYQLVGGSIIAYTPTAKKNKKMMMMAGRGGNSNMFRYNGPKGVKIACILDTDESSYGLQLQTDICITLPSFLPRLMNDGDLEPDKLRVVIFDEADVTLDETPIATLQSLLITDDDDDDDDDAEDDRNTRLTMMVGASMTESLAQYYYRDRILPKGKSWIATATKFAPLVLQDEDDDDTTANNSSSSSSSNRMLTTKADIEMATRTNNKVSQDAAYIQDLNICMDPGLIHERAIVGPSQSGLLILTRLLRSTLKKFDEKNQAAMMEAASKEEEEENNNGGNNNNNNAVPQQVSPRVVVFLPTEEEARAAIGPLRDAVWGDYKVCVLLPETGERPTRILEEFKSGQTSVMIATPTAIRGLDFPDLTHVYTLYLPIGSNKRDYVHLAGRVGRVGQMGSQLGMGGRVISILRQDDAHQMDELSEELGFDFVDVEVPNELLVEDTGDGNLEIERMRRLLEDTVTLLDDAEEPEIDLDAVEQRRKELLLLDEETDSNENDEEQKEKDSTI